MCHNIAKVKPRLRYKKIFFKDKLLQCSRLRIPKWIRVCLGETKIHIVERFHQGKNNVKNDFFQKAISVLFWFIAKNVSLNSGKDNSLTQVILLY